jgi:hypothetical protein
MGQRVTGCYPGGGSLQTNLPDNVGQPDSPGGASTPGSGDDTTFDPTTGVQTPTLRGDPTTWAPYNGCWAYSYDGMHSTDAAKVGSGGDIRLQPNTFPPLGWILPNGMPGTPPPSSGGPGGPAMPSPLFLAPPPPTDSGDDPPQEGGGSGGSPPPPQSCGAGTAPGTFAQLSIRVRGQEFDDVPYNDLRIINHDVTETKGLCLDLREPHDPTMFSVTADDGHFKFTVHFEVELQYRSAGSARTPPGGILR